MSDQIPTEPLTPAQERRQTRDHDVYFNKQFESMPIYVVPGSADSAGDDDEMLVATVGTGVLLTIFDDDLKCGAMGYVILPDAVLDMFPFLDKAGQTLVEKAFAPIERCIGEMKNRGAGKARIRIRLFGGVIRDGSQENKGLKNTVFVQEYLYRKGLQVYNADIGGPFIRRVHFFPSTGRAVRRMLKRQNDVAAIEALEREYNQNITSDT